MTPRLAGAICALTAAALLALSVVGIPWAFWDGHPTMVRLDDAGEKTSEVITAKTVHVGPLAATGCNTGGDDNCSALPMPAAFEITGYGTLAASGALIVALIILGITTLLTSESRKLVAKIVIAGAALATVAAATMLAQGAAPKTSTVVTLPLSPGIYMFGVAIVLTLASTVFATRPPPKLELRPSRAAIAHDLPAPPPAQPVDVLALLHAEPPTPRPVPPTLISALIPAQEAGPLPGPAGPLGAPQQRVDAFAQTAPQRPVAPVPPRATFPPAPPSFEPPRAPTAHGTAPVASMPPPPPRTKPPSLAPPPPPPSAAAPSTAPPPQPSRTRPMSAPPPPGLMTARLNASSVPAPVRAKPPSLAPIPQTLAGAVVPPPPAAPPSPVIAAKLPVRPATDPADHVETVERARDAESVGDRTDASVQIGEGDEHTAPSEPLDTEEAPIVAPPPPETMDVDTGVVPKQPAPEHRAASQAETVAHDKLSARELGEARTEVELLHRPSVPDLPKPPVAEPVAAVAAAPEPAAAPKIPITTAPDSLPPPKDKQVATSGPSPACPQCESPMAWVEEHLRFYCKSCRMYF